MMRRLHKKVNIVIVITKADTLTQTEVKRLKANILRDVEANGIQLYRFPECDSDEDEDFKRQDDEMKQSIPFAVVGSNTIFEVGGKKFRGRQYPWGVVDGKLYKHSLTVMLHHDDFIFCQQLKIPFIVISSNYEQCSFQLTCKISTTQHKMFTTKTSELNASLKWHRMPNRVKCEVIQLKRQPVRLLFPS